MTRPVFFHLGDGEYRAPGGYEVSFRDIYGDSCTLTLPDNRTFNGNWRECKRAANEHAQEEMQ